VEFYDANWEEIGTKSSLCENLSSVTGIDIPVLRGEDPTKRTVAERMSWAASRSTTRIEDTAYCLMGLFKVLMPMLYGEGSRAFIRLQEEILKQSEDDTIFAWKSEFVKSKYLYRGLFAHTPAEFPGPEGGLSKFYERLHEHEQPATMTSRGLLIDLPLLLISEEASTYLAWVCCLDQGNIDDSELSKTLVCVWLQELQSKPQIFVRILPEELELRPKTDASLFVRRQVYGLPSGTRKEDEIGEFLGRKHGTLRLHIQGEIVPPQLWYTDQLHFGDIPEAHWSSEKELSYSYTTGTCALVVLRFEAVQEFAILIGVRDDLPWCTILKFDEGINESLEKPRELFQHLGDFSWALHWQGYEMSIDQINHYRCHKSRTSYCTQSHRLQSSYSV
jgi:hypothetical protein